MVNTINFNNVLTLTGKIKRRLVLPDCMITLTLSSYNLSVLPRQFITIFTENPAVIRSLLFERISDTVTFLCNIKEERMLFIDTS